MNGSLLVLVKFFYVGKGSGDRYKQKKRNKFFNKIIATYAVGCRIVKKYLSEYDAYFLEVELIIQYTIDGHILSNIDIPGIECGQYESIKWDYNTTPTISVSKVEKKYFNIPEQKYDEIELDKLLYTHILKAPIHGISRVYLNDHSLELDIHTIEAGMQALYIVVEHFIESRGGVLYSNFPNLDDIRSVIIISNTTYDIYTNYKNEGIAVYHLNDVLNYIYLSQTVIP